MKFGKSLVLTLTLSALAGLTSCTQSPSTKWTELEKQNMILNANYAMPDMPFKATLDWGELPEEGYVQGPTSYSILVEAKAEKLLKWIEKMAPAEDAEAPGVGEWDFITVNSAGENVYAIYTSEKYDSFCFAYVDAEVGEITIQTLTFEFAGMAEIFDRQLGLYGDKDRSFSYCFGENFPELEIDEEETKVYQAWGGPEKAFKAANFNASYFMVYGYEDDKLATFREGLADAGWHIYGYTRSDGSKNSSIYCKEGMDGGFRMEEDTGSDGTPLLWVMMYTEMDDPHYRDGDDVCHPEIVTEKIEKISSIDNVDTFRVTLSDGSSFDFTVGQDPADPTKILITAPEGHTVAISEETGNWVVDEKDTGIKADLNVEVLDENEVLIQNTVTALNEAMSIPANYWTDDGYFGTSGLDRSFTLEVSFGTGDDCAALDTYVLGKLPEGWTENTEKAETKTETTEGEEPKTLTVYTYHEFNQKESIMTVETEVYSGKLYLTIALTSEKLSAGEVNSLKCANYVNSYFGGKSAVSDISSEELGVAYGMYLRAWKAESVSPDAAAGYYGGQVTNISNLTREADDGGNFVITVTDAEGADTGARQVRYSNEKTGIVVVLDFRAGNPEDYGGVEVTEFNAYLYDTNAEFVPAEPEATAIALHNFNTLSIAK